PPDPDGKSPTVKCVHIFPPHPVGNPLRAELSGCCPRSRTEIRFGRNCPDFAPKSGWKPASGRTGRILPPIPDGKPLRTELSGFCPEFRMENPLRAELSGNNGKNRMESAWAAVPSGFICLNELYLPAFSSWLSGRPISS